jgi:hypothetical protein
MKRLVTTLALVALTSCAANHTLSTSTQFANDPLIGSLMRNFGVTADQAVGAAGALLALGQNRMPASEWGKLASAVPHVGDIIKAGSTLGGLVGAPNSLADLQSPFAKLGLSQQQVSTLIPAVSQYVGSVAGPEVAGAFSASIQ